MKRECVSHWTFSQQQPPTEWCSEGLVWVSLVLTLRVILIELLHWIIPFQSNNSTWPAKTCVNYCKSPQEFETWKFAVKGHCDMSHCLTGRSSLSLWEKLVPIIWGCVHPCDGQPWVWGDISSNDFVPRVSRSPPAGGFFTFGSWCATVSGGFNSSLFERLFSRLVLPVLP